MRFTLDEKNLSAHVAERLRSAGHDVETVASENLFGISDHALIQACREEERCLITLDLDFANPLIFPPNEYAGIVVLRLRGAHNPVLEIGERIDTLLQALTTESPIRKLWIVEARRIRIYLPED
jgi:predicted nuclease of predicted toxin-antitoxin system